MKTNSNNNFYLSIKPQMIMKKLLYLFTAILFITSCGNDSELQAQLETMKQENEDLKIQNEQISEKDVLITEYSQFILDVQSNLDQIRKRENTVLLPKSGDEIVQTPEQIKEDLQQLGALLADNKKKIASMKLKLSNSSIQMDNLEKVIRTLSAKAEEREVKILGMKSELSDMGVAFDELMAAYENNIEVIADKNETIENQDNLLHTAYYTFGSKKELISNNVITAEGGFIGIGK
ncbi:MAG: chromosome segregation ATPase, partial [Flavobacteriales bacterium]